VDSLFSASVKLHQVWTWFARKYSSKKNLD